MNLIRFLFIIFSIVLILLLNTYLFMPDFSQVCEYALCCSLNIPVKSDYDKDKFYHVIDKNQLELFSKNIQDVLVGSLQSLLGEFNKRDENHNASCLYHY